MDRATEAALILAQYASMRDRLTGIIFYNCRVCGGSMWSLPPGVAPVSRIVAFLRDHLEDHGILPDDLLLWQEAIEEHARDLGGETAR